MSAASHLHVPVERTMAPAYREYPARRRAQRRRVHPLARLGPLMVTGLCAAVFLTVGLGYVAQKARLMTKYYELAALQDELAQLEKERMHLQLALMKATSPRQVEYLARQRLGMHEPKQVAYLVLDGGEAASGEAAVADHREPQAVGVVAAVGDWLSQHWPIWGRAEASAGL